ncbi:MAG: hypothetical protein KVP17_003806 [Porospora cf. gigantea B]|uniref:uncharacterized protein n=1 Tax=Porospora cf. gigantea B TaxID=2853592 RepID=UPI003571CC75|nr:MAG: hypothetical protein KVP17_003806 [Porospora cf. gigantea B]
MSRTTMLEKVRAEMARKNLLPDFADSTDSVDQKTPAFEEDFDAVEITTQRQGRGRESLHES